MQLNTKLQTFLRYCETVLQFVFVFCFCNLIVWLLRIDFVGNLLHCQRLVVSRDRRPIPSPFGSSYYLWAGLRVKPLKMIKKATP